MCVCMLACIFLFMARPLRLGFWNLNGYNSRTLGNKLKTKEFLNIINKHDIFAVVETHATYDFRACR